MYIGKVLVLAVIFLKLEEAVKNIKCSDKDIMKKSEEYWISIAKPLFSLGKLETEI